MGRFIDEAGRLISSNDLFIVVARTSGDPTAPVPLALVEAETASTGRYNPGMGIALAMVPLTLRLSGSGGGGFFCRLLPLHL